MTPTTMIAIYGAVVSTAAAAFSFRRWLITGPRLALSGMGRAKAYGGAVVDNNTYISLTVENRGDLATTLTTMTLFQFRSFIDRWRRRPSYSALVKGPNIFGGADLPHLLASGTRWMGLVRYDDDLFARVRQGNLFVAIYGSHSRRPAIMRVHWDLTDAEKAACGAPTLA